MTALIEDVNPPAGWTMRPLRYLANLNPETLSEAHDPEAEIAYIDIGSVGRGELVEQPEVMAFGEAPSRARRVVRDGDILVSTVRTYLRAVLRLEDVGSNTVASTGFATLRPAPDVDNRYLYYWCLSDPFVETVVAKSKGVSYPAINASELLSLPVALPSLEVQQRVADMLDAETARIDTLVAKNDHVCSLLDLRQASLLEDRIYHRSDVTLTPLQYLCDPARPIRYGIVLPGPDVDDGVPLIKGGDVHGHTLHLGTQCRVDFEVERAHARSRVREGDLVYAIRGSFGDVEIVPDHLDGANTTQDVARIAPRTVDARWLLHALRAPGTLSQAKRSSRGATISGVNIESLRAFVLPVPSRTTQVKVRESLDRNIAQLEELSAKVARQQELLSQRRQALVTAAVTGQITV